MAFNNSYGIKAVDEKTYNEMKVRVHTHARTSTRTAAPPAPAQQRVCVCVCVCLVLSVCIGFTHPRVCDLIRRLPSPAAQT
jgi:hypothetical protein